jgi:hypothetical protein
VRIIRLLSIVLFAFSALAVDANAQALDNPRAFHIRVHQAADTSGLRIYYNLTGPFGGYSSFVDGRTNVSDYPIKLSFDKKPARTLKAIIFCPGYQIAIIDVPSLAGLKEKSEDVQLKPLPSVSLSGKVMSPAHPATDDFKISIRYEADWEQQFFGITDGPVAEFDIATVTLAKDGSFTATLPDFTLDPVVNSFAEQGVFTFTAYNQRPFRLEPAENQGRGGYGLQIASQYLYGLRFYPRQAEVKPMLILPD